MPDGGREQLGRERLAQLGQDVAGQHLPGSDLGGQDGGDGQAGVEAGRDELDGAQQRGDTVQVHRAGADRDQDLAGGHQGVDGEQAEGGWAVEQNQVAGFGVGEGSAQGHLCAGLAAQDALDADQVDGGGQHLQAGGDAGGGDVVDAAAAVQDLQHGAVVAGGVLVGGGGQPAGGAGLGVQVDEQDPHAGLSGDRGDADGGGGLGDAALLVDDRDGAASSGAHRGGLTHRGPAGERCPRCSSAPGQAWRRGGCA